MMIRFLRVIGGYDLERDSGKEGLTVAGLLLLGTDKALRSWRSRHVIDYRLISDENSPEKRWDDRILWEGHLFGAFEAIYPRLISGLSTAFELQGAVRVSQSSVHVVLREALVNLIVHADYAVSEASLIVRTPSSFFFRNPGSSRISEFDLLHGDRSDPHNPELVRMFRMIGLAEEAGTGIPKIIRAWRELGLEMPKIDTGTERYEFVLQLRQAHLLAAEERSWLKKLDSQWSEAEQLALVHARNHGYIDNATLTRLTGQHSADISKVLVGLRNRQFLQMIGGGRYARYELGSRAIHEKLNIRVGVKYQEETIPDEVWNELMQVGEVVRSKPRVDRATLEETIVQLCSITPLGVNEIIELIGRKKLYVQGRKGLPSLLASGRIGYLYPEHPSHPRQKYSRLQVYEVQ